MPMALFGLALTTGLLDNIASGPLEGAATTASTSLGLLLCIVGGGRLRRM